MSVECVNQLGFQRPLTSLVKETLIVRNPNNRPVAFKIKTTAPKQYCVRPNSGRIEPGQEVEVQVLLQAMKEDPPADFRCRDKFLVQSTIISAENESSSISVLWSAVEARNREDIHEKKIRCVFLAQDGGSSTRGPSHEIQRDESPAPTYHGAETSTDANQFNTPGQQASAGRADLFKIAPALASINTPQNSSITTGNDSGKTNPDNSMTQRAQGSSADTQLKEANLKIEKLQQQLSVANSTSRRSDPKSAVHNQGVPVPMTALIALIAFMAAYLLF